MFTYASPLSEQRLLNDDVPRYFKRYWDMGAATIQGLDPKTMTPIGEPELINPGAGWLTIYGYAWASPYPEDKHAEDYAWKRNRSFCAWCFSEVEPAGEMGMTPADDVIPIALPELIAGLTRLGVPDTIWARVV